MKTGSLLVLAGAGLAAWLLLSQKGQGEGGTGGSLDIPAMFGTGNIGGDPVPGVSPTSQPSFPISDKIAAAIRASPSQGLAPVGGFSQLSYRGSSNFFTPSKTELSQSFIPVAGQSFSTPSAKKVSSLYGSGASSYSAPVGNANYSFQGGGNYTGVVAATKKSSNNFGLGKGRTTRY